MKNLIDVCQNVRDYTVSVQIDESTAEPVWDYKLVGDEKKDLHLIHGNMGDETVEIPVEEIVTAGELSDYLSEEVEPDEDVRVFSEKTDEEYPVVKTFKRLKHLVFYLK